MSQQLSVPGRAGWVGLKTVPHPVEFDPKFVSEVPSPDQYFLSLNFNCKEIIGL